MNIAIMSCEQIKDEACIGCQRCLTAMHRREGELERYRDDPQARIVAIFHCGGCPGNAPVVHMKQLQSWMAPMGETVDVIHMGTCVKNHRPHREELVEAVRAKAGVEVVEGTHPYLPVDIFAH